MDCKCTFSYETEANSSFLVAVLKDHGDLVQYQMRMMENNHIINLLDARKYRHDEDLRICYNVTSHLSLAQATAGQKMKREEFLTVLNGVAETMQELPEYQLSAKGLVLDESYIFVTPENFAPSFVYLPLYVEDDGMESLRQFIRKIVLESRIAATNDDFIQRLLDMTNDPALTPETFARGLERLQEKKRQPVMQPTAPIQPAPPKFPDPVPFTPKPVPAQESTSAPASTQPQVNVSPKKNKQDKQTKKGRPAKEKKEKSGTTKESLIFTVVQAAFVLGLAVLTKNGFFRSEAGGVNISYIAGALIAVAGLDVVLYRELFINSKQEKKPAKVDKKKKKIAGGKNAKKTSETVQSSVHMDPPVAEPVGSVMPSAVTAPKVAYVPVAAPVPCAPAGENDDKTEVIEADDFAQGYLEYYENGLAMRIHLNEGVTRVGSLAQKVNHVLASHKVSKIHAEFVRQGDTCYVRDLNSTNGTFINGNKQRIVSNQNFQLHNGDRVRLADIEMVFKC